MWAMESILNGFFIAIAVVLGFPYISYRLYIIIARRLEFANINPKPPKRFQNPVERLIGFYFIPVITGAIAKAGANTAFPDGTNVTNLPYCKFQTVFIEFSDMACTILQLLLAWNLFTTIRVFRHGRPWPMEYLTAKLIERERIWIPLAFSIGLLFALVSTIFAGPRNYWCWVMDTSPVLNYSLNTLLIYYLWLWIVWLAGIFALLVAAFDYFMNSSDYQGEGDFRIAYIVAFFWFILSDLIVWVLASADRFWSFAYPGCFNVVLGMSHAILGSGHGIILTIVYAALLYGKKFPLEPKLMN